MERLDSVGYQGRVGRFRPEQIAQQSTWAVVPDESLELAAMTRIHQVPENGSTCTYVNPLDPAYGPDDWRDHGDPFDTLVPARGRL